MTRSLRVTSQAVPKKEGRGSGLTVRPSISVAQCSRSRIDRQEPPAAQQDSAIREAVDRFEVVSRQQDDTAGAAQISKARSKRAGCGIVEARKRLVEEHQPRFVQQRPL